MNITTYGVDIAKNVMQIHSRDLETGEILRRTVKRAKLTEFFAKLQPCRIAMEACGGAQHWARTLGTLGHQVELLPARQVRPFVSGNKDDAADARAIYLAAQHSDIRRVSLKSVEQQALQSVHRMRTQTMRNRVAAINALHGHLNEFGVILPQGKTRALQTIAREREGIEAKLPELARWQLRKALEDIGRFDQDIKEIEQQLKVVQRTNDAARRLTEIPGIGLLGSTALAATLGDGSGWHNGRNFAVFTGVTPKHTGTGGKVRIGGMSKRGDPYVRTLLIHAARSLLRLENKPEWVVELLARRPANVVAVAIANKLARIAWALVAHQRSFDKEWRSLPPVRGGAAATVAVTA